MATAKELRAKWEAIKAEAPSLEAAIGTIERELPGWWWTTGHCGLSAHASIGPDISGPDAGLLVIELFDGGFHADLLQPSTPARALLHAFEQARKAKREQLNK